MFHVLDSFFHANHMGSSTDLVCSAKDCMDSGDASERGVGVKALRHKTVSHIPLLAIKKIMLDDLGVAVV
jgi:hypothetical protein